MERIDVMTMPSSIKFASMLIFCACFIPSAMANEVPATLAGVKVVNALEAKKLLDEGVPLIDTRGAAEYA